ncbi:MAG TPA: AAA family ATPase [Dinghuibacter sp.]|uniref:McrB family protein n=1 Tax=Dinghuibacter sp. TaxID=2024697 RepID=UPI002BC2ED42|nr:AAA family ATPase [Dinghuibacter sp.]HTJ12289.1 AAA family ATPase [Dinghuibacter sp.]
MKSKDLEAITISHVRQAAAIYDPRNFSARSVARNTVVSIDGKAYPVKNIGAIAYRLAYDKDLPLASFTTVEMSNYFKSLRSDDIVIEKLDQTGLPFFEEAELVRFSEIIHSDERRYRKDDADSAETSEVVKLIFDKTNYWARQVAGSLPGWGFEEDNMWQIGGNFKSYSWATVFSEQDRKRPVFFTLGVDSDQGGRLVLKLDCQRSGSGKLAEGPVTVFDQYLRNNGVVWKVIAAASIEEYDWEKLVAETVDYIHRNEPYYRASLDMDVSRSRVESIKTMAHIYSLNTILYGPPGTGKTYNTIDIACDILGFQPDPDAPDQKARKDKREFFEGKLDDRIEFVTFHQSMSYENFIEGIKPKEVGTNLTYKTEPGIFSKIAYRALQNIHSYYEKSKIPSIDFNSVYKEFIRDVQQRAATNPLLFTTTYDSRLRYDKMHDATTMVVYFQFNDRSKQSGPGRQPFNVRLDKIKLLYDSKVPDKIKSLKDEIKPIVKYNESVYFAVYKDFLKFLSNKYPGYSIQEAQEADGENLPRELAEMEDYGRLLQQTEDLLAEEGDDFIKSDPYILIIDEINRGNVSQIFGEIITLIEDDKRFLRAEGTRVKLSYSQSQFSVPPNLYIIGTMNTADRSVEALDTALRRRFSFLEMPPQDRHEKISKAVGIHTDVFDFQEVLRTINRRLEMLLDRDHAIGHSYFLDPDGVRDWRFYLDAFEKKIVPQLQEYFYGDYGKIGLVLGGGFIKERKNENGDRFFAAIDYEDAAELVEKRIWEIRAIRDELEFAQALRMLLNN